MSQEKKTPTITPTPNGPYLVRDLESLQGTRGPLPAKAMVALCRCGGSNNKPFCDGTHARNGFSSEKLPGRVADKRDTYIGASITVTDNRGQCAHAGFCTDGAPATFRLKKEPFVDPDADSAEKIAKTIDACPSGALRYLLDGVDKGDRSGVPNITVTPNGPYRVSGSCELLKTTFGEGNTQDHYTLCRCGGSKNKPFCDGTHWTNKFKAE